MRVFSTVAATVVAVASAERVMPVFETAPVGDSEEAFQQAYESFLSEFPVEKHEELMKNIDESIASYLKSTAFAGTSNCGGSSGGVDVPRKISAFPGGSTKRVFGMDISKLVDKLASSASGAAGAQGSMPGLLAMQALTTGAGLVKSAMSSVLQIVPRVAPPHQPLTCMPMVTGHNCFGAIQHPITAADFVTADTTDATLDGVIAGFPALYKRKVGSTSDSAYKACFSAYMGMHCASLFPRCAAPAAEQAPTPIGRLPMCFTHCLATLVACPGMWIEDIAGECSNVSVPPMCTMSAFANFWLLPPQYTSFEDSLPTDQSCPSVPASLAGAESGSGIYDDSSIAASAYRVPVA